MKKLLALALACTLFTGSLAGCKTADSPGSEAEPASSAAPAAESASTPDAPEGPVELTFWYWADNADQSKVMQDIVKEFNDTNGQGITVTAEEYPWEGGGFTDSIFTANMGGGGPDISFFKLNAGRLFAANSILKDITPYFDAWEDKGQFNDELLGTMRSATDDGKLSLLPMSLEALFFYYRPSYFEMAGVEVPTTIDELLTAIEKCTMDTDGDGKIDVYGYGMRGASGGHEHIGNFIYPFGGSWDDLTTADSVAGYQAYLDVYNKGYAPESAANAAYAELIDGFKSGLSAMMIHHIGSVGIWREAFGDDVGAFSSPTGPGGRWTCMGEVELVMYEKCEHPEAAFEFMKYMTTGQGGTDWFVGSGKGLPFTENVQSTDKYKQEPIQLVAAESLEFSGVLPLTDTVTEFVNTTWAATNQQALLGEITAAEAMEIMNKSIHG